MDLNEKEEDDAEIRRAIGQDGDLGQSPQLKVPDLIRRFAPW
jgi:hypothetical protein